MKLPEITLIFPRWGIVFLDTFDYSVCERNVLPGCFDEALFSKWEVL